MRPLNRAKPPACSWPDLALRIAPPQSAAGGARLGLGGQQTVEPRGVRRQRHRQAQPGGQLRRRPAAPVATEGMRQAAAVAITRLRARLQVDAPGAGGDQPFEVAHRLHREGLGGTPAAGRFRRVEADQPHAAAIGQAQGVAIDHPLHPRLAQSGGHRAGLGGRWLRGQQPQQRSNEKGAP